MFKSVRRREMIQDIITILRQLFLRHKGVRTFRYQKDTKNNAKNSNKAIQVYVDSVVMNELNITNGVFKSTYEIYVLIPHTDNTPTEENQSRCLTVAADVMAAIDEFPEYRGIISVYDYSILTLDGYSDDNCDGVRLTLTLNVPSPVSLCALGDNFNDEPYEEEEDKEIDVPEQKEPEIDDIVTITIPTHKRC